MMTMGLDVGLAPLVGSKFNESKSVLKWEEYAALGVPCIASNVPPYSDTLKSGVDGILVDDDGWYEALCRMYEHREESKAIGSVARRRIESEFSHKHVANQWLDTLLRLNERRESTLVLTGTEATLPHLGGMSRMET